MALDVQTLTREFKHGSLVLQDPDPKMTAEQVKDFYATTLYTELTNAAIEGPEQKGNKLAYEFRRAVGTKGAGTVAGSLRAHLDALVDGTAPQLSNYPSDECFEISNAIARCSRISLEPSAAGMLHAPSALLPPLP
jgi:PRTRC genetic system protein C